MKSWTSFLYGCISTNLIRWNPFPISNRIIDIRGQVHIYILHGWKERAHFSTYRHTCETLGTRRILSVNWVRAAITPIYNVCVCTYKCRYICLLSRRFRDFADLETSISITYTFDDRISRFSLANAFFLFVAWFSWENWFLFLRKCSFYLVGGKKWEILSCFPEMQSYALVATYCNYRISH